MTKVKICGLTRAADAELAVELGADALGFVLEPSSPRRLDVQKAEWLAGLPPFVPRVAVFGPIPHNAIFEPFHILQAIQFPDEMRMRFKTIQSIRLKSGQTAEDFLELPRLGEAVLLDAHSDKAFGGTGKTIDWEVAAKIVDYSDRRVVLAGGLTPDNVTEAIRTVHPYAVDVSSGVETEPGIKDPGKMRDFIQAAKGA